MITQEQGDKICERLARGESLRAICRDMSLSESRCREDFIKDRPPGIAAQSAHAREQGCHSLAEQCLEIADEPAERDDTGRIDSAGVQHKRVRIDTRVRLLGKWLPSVYGDKVTQDINIARAPVDLSDDELGHIAGSGSPRALK